MTPIQIELTAEQIEQLAPIQERVNARRPGTDYVIFAQIVLSEPLLRKGGATLQYTLLCMPAFGKSARALTSAGHLAHRARRSACRAGTGAGSLAERGVVVADHHRLRRYERGRLPVVRGRWSRRRSAAR